VTRHYATDEQYERWYVIDCCRCGQRRTRAGSWPDGNVCRTCVDRGLRTRGTCPGCGQERALPGRRAGDNADVCTGCAGFSQSFTCSRCGFEGKLHGGKLCTRCTFADRLADLLDDGSGRIRPDPVPLADSLIAMDNPLSGLTWLYKRANRTGSASNLLRRLGRGEIELTHEAFITLQPWRAAVYLRDLLMSCGVLPAADKQVCGFERWLASHLAGIADETHAKVIRRFATWEVLPRLRARAEKKPLSTGARGYAVGQVLRATEFLQWLSARGLALAECCQTDIDAWFAGSSENHRSALRPFLQWCMASKMTRRFQLPPTVPGHSAPMPDRERVEHLGRVLAGHGLPLRTRAAAAIVLLYAQPASRIVRLTVDDVTCEDGEVFLRLGDPPSPVPGPVADLLLSWIGSRTNMRTAANRNSAWLFPGRQAGQPMRPDYLARLLCGIGIPTTAGRTSAIRQHVLEAPAPVVADALSYSQGTTARLAAQAGGTFSRYAPGNNKRQAPGGEGDS
jgi:integrase